jgi:hypothetical protein
VRIRVSPPASEKRLGADTRLQESGNLQHDFVESEPVAELLPASFAALGAVVGLLAGASFGSQLFGPAATWPLVAGGLLGALVCAWLGLRFANRNAERS